MDRLRQRAPRILARLEAHKLLGQLYLATGRQTEAEQHLRSQHQQAAFVEGDLDLALKLHPATDGALAL